MQTWEYMWFEALRQGMLSNKVIPSSLNGFAIPQNWKGLETHAILNQLGEAGWELVSSNALMGGDPVYLLGWVFLLKRPKSSTL